LKHGLLYFKWCEAQLLVQARKRPFQGTDTSLDAASCDLVRASKQKEDNSGE